MRKLMLAATAIAGMTGLAAGHASAQTPAEPVLTSDSFASGLATGATLAPGTVTVRLRAELWTELSYGQDSATKVGTGKESGVLLGSFARLFPKFDARAANGLEYGATMEIRMNSGGTGGTTGNTLFFRRYNGYVGTPTVGRLYVGPENMADARLSAGTVMEDFDYNGGFNGDVPAAVNGNVQLSYFTLRQSNTYGNNNLVYISPSFAGFTFGTSWEPSQSTGEAGLSGGNVLNPTTSSISGGAAVRRNTYDAALQYKGSFGPVALSAFAGYVGSGHVTDSTFTSASLPQYKNWSIVNFGGRATFGPASIGFNMLTGAYNNGGGLIRQGQRNGTNLVAGAQYIIGPVIMGVQYVNNIAGGQYNSNPTFTRSMRHDTGVVVGGAWDYAPGSTLYASASYNQIHQFGTNIVTGGSNTSVGNSAQARAIQIGNTWKW